MVKDKPKQKLYVVRKYIMANTAKEAIKKERTIAPDDVWVDEDFKRQALQDRAPAIGFHIAG